MRQLSFDLTSKGLGFKIIIMNYILKLALCPRGLWNIEDCDGFMLCSHIMFPTYFIRAADMDYDEAYKYAKEELLRILTA